MEGIDSQPVAARSRVLDRVTRLSVRPLQQRLYLSQDLKLAGPLGAGVGTACVLGSAACCTSPLLYVLAV